MAWAAAFVESAHNRSPCGLLLLEVPCMLDLVRLLQTTDVFLLAFSALVFDVPRYTLSLVSYAVFGARQLSRIGSTPARRPSVSVIVPTFNGGSGLDPTIRSL